MKKEYIYCLVFILISSCLYATDFQLLGECKVLSKNETEPLINSIVYVAPNKDNPVATDSILLIGSHSVMIYPSSSVKLINEGFIPLTGRVSLNNFDERTKKLIIKTNKCNCEYIYGNFQIEVTPDSGTYFAMNGEGYAWVKDKDRKIFEIKRNTELFFPLYGETVKSKELSGFWQEKPSTFGGIR